MQQAVQAQRQETPMYQYLAELQAESKVDSQRGAQQFWQQAKGYKEPVRQVAQIERKGNQSTGESGTDEPTMIG